MNVRRKFTKVKEGSRRFAERSETFGNVWQRGKFWRIEREVLYIISTCAYFMCFIIKIYKKFNLLSQQHAKLGFGSQHFALHQNPSLQDCP